MNIMFIFEHEHIEENESIITCNKAQFVMP